MEETDSAVTSGYSPFHDIRPPSIQRRNGAHTLSMCARADEMVTALSKDGFVSAKAIITTGLVRDVTQRQRSLALAAAALGRTMTCCLLLSEGLKQEESFQVSFRGDGPLNGVMAQANGKLEVKGFVGNSQVTLPPNANGKVRLPS